MNTTPKWVSFGAWTRLGLLSLLPAVTVIPVQAFRKDALNIYVRSVVAAGAKETGLQPPDAKRHEIYLLAPVRELPSAYKLAKPVDPKVIEKESRSILEKKGYVPAMQGDHPAMVITVSYGRGYLSNPYMESAGWGGVTYGDVPGNGFQPSVTGASIQTITFPTVESFGPWKEMHERQRQYAEYEKLVIIVAAFDYDAMLKKKAKLLWRTAMYIDDPDHRNLNQITKQLLAAGADYFNRQSEGKEVEVTKPLPEGYVEIGRERVMEQPAKDPR